MSYKKTKILIPVTAACCLALGSGAAIAFVNGEIGGALPSESFTALANASAAQWSDSSINEEYAFGSSFTVPDRTLTVDGKQASSVAVLTFPDGTATLKKTHVLSMTGVYTVTYSAEVGGKRYAEEVKFSVYDGVARIGENSSAVYKQLGDTGIYGLQVDLAQGDTIEFPQLIDLKDATKNDSIIEFFVTPSQIGEYDFERLIFTLTDADDPSVSMRIAAYRSVEGQPSTYFQAGGQNQPTAGHEFSTGKTHYNNEWGEWVLHSFQGRDGKVDTEHTVKMCYDAQENALYVGGKFVIDFDDPAYFTTLWSGFKSGKARLGITADKYVRSSVKASFMLTKIKGVDFTAERFGDTDAPEITIDTPYAVAPTAKVGTAYPIPQATAHDDYSGNVSVSTAVYYNYASDSAFNIQISNGSFTPDRIGNYTVVYTAKDGSGNVTSREMTVRAEKVIPPITIELSAPEVTTCTVGTLVNAADAEVSGGSGKASVKTEVIFGGAATEIKDKFRPEKSGTYTVKYTATDYIGQTATKEYTVTVTPSDIPVFVDEPTLPKYFIAGCEYDLSAYAYKFSDSDKERVDATLTVTDANGENVVSGAYVPKVAKTGDEVTVAFKAGDATLVRKIKCIIPFVEDGDMLKLHMENYFVTDDAIVASKQDGVTVTAKQSGGSTTAFVNKLVANGFNINLRALPTSGITGLKITLTDSLDVTESVTLDITANGNIATASTRFGSAEITSGFTNNSNSNDFNIVYNDGAFTVGGASVSVGDIRFSSHFVYVTVESVGESDNAAYDVLDINEQPFSDSSTDRIKPKIAIIGSYDGSAKYEEQFRIPTAVAGDVLDANCTLTLTVRTPSGETATSVDGISLENVSADREYFINAAQYGQYLVSYTSRDTFNERDNRLTYAVTVEDREKPTIKFNTAFEDSVKVGELIVIPDYTVSDNVSSDITVIKYIVTAGGTLVELEGESNAFRPSGAGTYEIRIIVKDEAGNVTMVQQAVNVTE